MRRVSWGVSLAVVAGVLLGAVGVSPASATTLTASAAAVSPVANRGYAQEILADINRTRADAGLKALKADKCVQKYADAYALTMDRADLWEHSDLYSLLGKCGYRYAAENLAMVSDGATPQHVVDLWMASPGHRANILSSKPAVSAIAVIWDATRDSWIVVHNFGTKKKTTQSKAVARKSALSKKALAKKHHVTKKHHARRK